jgi:hypothetical protein
LAATQNIQLKSHLYACTEPPSGGFVVFAFENCFYDNIPAIIEDDINKDRAWTQTTER